MVSLFLAISAAEYAVATPQRGPTRRCPTNRVGYPVVIQPRPRSRVRTGDGRGMSRVVDARIPTRPSHRPYLSRARRRHEVRRASARRHLLAQYHTRRRDRHWCTQTGSSRGCCATPSGPTGTHRFSSSCRTGRHGGRGYRRHHLELARTAGRKPCTSCRSTSWIPGEVVKSVAPVFKPRRGLNAGATSP